MLVAIALAVVQAPARPAMDFKGRLYRAVFVNGPDTLSSGDIAQAPEPMRERLSRFLKRRNSFTSLYESTPKDLVAAQADAKRRSIERGIVSLIESAGIEQRAVAFVTAAPIKYEWEGDPAGPLDECAYAEHVLELEPSTPLAPVPLSLHRPTPARGGGGGRACREPHRGPGRGSEGEDVPPEGARGSGPDFRAYRGRPREGAVRLRAEEGGRRHDRAPPGCRLVDAPLRPLRRWPSHRTGPAWRKRPSPRSSSTSASTPRSRPVTSERPRISSSRS